MVREITDKLRIWIVKLSLDYGLSKEDIAFLTDTDFKKVSNIIVHERRYHPAKRVLGDIRQMLFLGRDIAYMGRKLNLTDGQIKKLIFEIRK